MPAKIVFTEDQIVYIKKRYLEDRAPVETIGREVAVSASTLNRIMRAAGIASIKRRGKKNPVYPVDEHGNKRCIQCLQIKSVSEFHRVSNKKQLYGYNVRCKPCGNLYTRACRDRKLGIEPEDYAAKALEQKYLCALCHKPETKTGQYGVYRLALDHDHSNGKARSLLCSRCNKLLGALNDDSALFRAFADYIDEWRLEHEKG